MLWALVGLCLVSNFYCLRELFRSQKLNIYQRDAREALQGSYDALSEKEERVSEVAIGMGNLLISTIDVIDGDRSREEWMDTLTWLLDSHREILEEYGGKWAEARQSEAAVYKRILGEMKKTKDDDGEGEG